MSLALDANISNNHEGDSSKSYKDNVSELLQTWSTFSSTLAANDATLVGIAIEICNILSRRNSFDALEVFLDRLPKIPEYANSQEILRSKIALALKRKQPKVVQNILKNNTFENCDDLIKVWDEAHYIEEEERLQKQLTPLARFRVRKRNPPPKTICPSGVRKMASLPKAATRILKQWLIDHFNDPYPSGEEKVALATFSGLTPNQVKTWFANARRRIHKGESFQSTKRTGNGLDVKDNNFAKNQFMILSDFDESYPVEVNLPTDSVPLFGLPHFSGRSDHSAIANTYDRMPGFSYRCMHSMYSPHSCFHCKDMLGDANNCIGDYTASTDPRCYQHSFSMNPTLPVHPTPTYSFPRWSYRSAFQFRQDDFDALYRNIAYQSEMSGHSFSAEVQGDRSCTMESSGQSMLNHCLGNNSGMSEKQGHINMATSKDALTEVGAAQILADLSSKQNFDSQYDQAESVLTNPSA